MSQIKVDLISSEQDRIIVGDYVSLAEAKTKLAALASALFNINNDDINLVATDEVGNRWFMTQNAGSLMWEAEGRVEVDKVACPTCGNLPGEGRGCDNPDGCGYAVVR